MTTERNAQGVDGLAEVMRLLRRPEDKSLVGADLADARNLAAVAAVNYLRSHGGAIRELVEAGREELEVGFNVAPTPTRRRLSAALAKFTTENRKE